MTAFVILAAGPGTRSGRDDLHKALLPLSGRAVISHQIERAPPGSRLIVCTGAHPDQLTTYLRLAHPGLPVEFVHVPDWDAPCSGPGATLLAARDAVGDDAMVFTSCDTLWAPDPDLWTASSSWAGVASVPRGTEPERWCRIYAEGMAALEVWDKQPGPPGGHAFTGLAFIRRDDLPDFWHGLAKAPLLRGERRDTGGLRALAAAGRLEVRWIHWADTGDEAAYARVVTSWDGFDWSKPGEATWVLPASGRVVKYDANPGRLARIIDRQHAIAAATPELIEQRRRMAAWEYAPGATGYEAAATDPHLLPRLLDWASVWLWRQVTPDDDTYDACLRFYLKKTLERVAQLPPGLCADALEALHGLDWDALAKGCDPVTYHGDLNLGNVIVDDRGGFTLIDWRDSFAGHVGWGDRRYDLGKLAAGLVVHWGRARHGGFDPWPEGAIHLAQLGDWLGGLTADLLTVAGLSLINSAPLHREPLQAVLVDRGVALLQQTRD